MIRRLCYIKFSQTYDKNNKGSTLSPPSTMCPPRFSDLATALHIFAIFVLFLIFQQQFQQSENIKREGSWIHEQVPRVSAVAWGSEGILLLPQILPVQKIEQEQKAIIYYCWAVGPRIFGPSAASGTYLLFEIVKEKNTAIILLF